MRNSKEAPSKQPDQREKKPTGSFPRRFRNEIAAALVAGTTLLSSVSNDITHPAGHDRGENSGFVQGIHTVLEAQNVSAHSLSATDEAPTFGAIVMDAIPPVLGPASNARDYDLGDPSGKVMGHVYTETNGTANDNTRGYYFYNGPYQRKDGSQVKINLWDQFKKDSDANGGVSADGYPVANPYFDDQGRLCVATQKRIRQYSLDGNGNIIKTELMNIYDEIAKKKSLDNNTDLVSDSFPWSSDSNPILPSSWGHTPQGGNPGTIEANHINTVFGPLNTNLPKFKEYYLSHSDWFDRFGMPMAYKEYTVSGAKVIVVRCQRSVLQIWGQDMPWAKAEKVVESNAGDDAKKYGLIPSDATQLLNIGLGGSVTPETPAPKSDINLYPELKQILQPYDRSARPDLDSLMVRARAGSSGWQWDHDTGYNTVGSFAVLLSTELSPDGQNLIVTITTDPSEMDPSKVQTINIPNDGHSLDILVVSTSGGTAKNITEVSGIKKDYAAINYLTKPGDIFSYNKSTNNQPLPNTTNSNRAFTFVR